MRATPPRPSNRKRLSKNSPHAKNSPQAKSGARPKSRAQSNSGAPAKGRHPRQTEPRAQSSHPEKSSHLGVKELYLLRLWDDYLQSGQLHQLDRFLAQALRKIKNAGKRDRLWYGDHLFAMSRYAWIALFLHDSGLIEAFSSSDSEAASDFHAAGVTEDQQSLFQTRLADWQPPETVEAASAALQKLRAPGVWRTAQQRLALVDANADDSTATEPHAIEPRATTTRSADPRNIATRACLLILRQLAREGQKSAELLWAGISPQWQPQIDARAQASQWDTAARQRFIDSHTARPPLYIRPLPDKTEEVFTDLRDNGLTATPLEKALCITGSKGLYELESYQQGWFEIQDLASQAIGEHVAAKPGELGWDACAGGGGKSMQLASAMQGKGAVYASDIREYKLDEIRRRAQRAQLHNIRTFVWQGEPLDRLPTAVAKRGGFDWVLVDAPCSSSGTWRRNPDARWRIDESQLAEITALQAKLLASAALSVRPGGRVVYSTCSFFVEENEQIVAAFLEQHPEFTLSSQHLHGNPKQNADTMFSALLLRAAS
ncbi:Hypothetical protein HDN1F_21870 [gamma proteobacterium HdN1]|nr:Hypothetical protein HDN1F_21870 [gamma proteobacterium HdN1]